MKILYFNQSLVSLRLRRLYSQVVLSASISQLILFVNDLKFLLAQHTCFVPFWANSFGT